MNTLNRERKRMNLNGLFPEQKKLDNEIVENHNLQGQDLKDKKTVALLTELYECVNEARFFKFWSKDQKARTAVEVSCVTCKGNGIVSLGERIRGVKNCPDCNGRKGTQKTVNLLLEEYVDTIHFTLSLAMEYEYNSHEYEKTKAVDLSTRILDITYLISSLRFMEKSRYTNMGLIFNNLIDLGYQFGFKEEQIIAAYHDKHQINKERQVHGY